MDNTDESQTKLDTNCIMDIGILNANDMDEQTNTDYCPHNKILFVIHRTENGCYLTKPENNNL